MNMTVTRRTALAALGASSAGLASPALSAPRRLDDARFLHGVASGDPTAAGAILWTRATPAEGATGDIPLQWHVAEQAGAQPIRSGRVTAAAARDNTAKVEVTRLQPGRDYWYWFTTSSGTPSPLGRFRTLPVGRTEDFILALASCQLWAGGFFNAYDDMARLDRLDAVLHLGDYIYEYGADGYGTDIGRQLGRLPDPPHEIITLADYRRRHAQVKTDPALQAAHARAAFITVWDDHETANDAWIGGAENHDPATEGDWRARKAAALQAYFEWMPIRDPRRGSDPAAIFRSFEIGDLATLAMVETRLLGRDEQIASKGEVAADADIARMLRDRQQPDRELLGAAQFAWLENVLRRSVDSDKVWQLLGNQVVMARVAGPDIELGYGPERFAAIIARMPEGWRTRIRATLAGYRAGLPFNMDAWDGYPAARERLYAMLRRIGARPVMFAGDSHAAWANHLADASGTVVASEFGTTAISSPSFGSLLPGLGQIIAAQNDEVVFNNQDDKGYTLVTLTREAVTAEFVTVSTVMSRAYQRGVAGRFTRGTERGARLRAV